MKIILCPTPSLCPSGWSRADLSPLSALHAALWITADSFGSPVEETQSSAPGGPGDDLLGGESASD